MVLDCVVSGLALALQLAGWSSLVWSMVCIQSRMPAWGYGVFTFSLIGMGVITLITAQMQSGCALVCGLTVSLWLLALIALPGPNLAVDRYAALYAEDCT